MNTTRNIIIGVLKNRLTYVYIVTTILFIVFILILNQLETANKLSSTSDAQVEKMKSEILASLAEKKVPGEADKAAPKA